MLVGCSFVHSHSLHSYAAFTIHCLPQLQMLDGIDITAQARVRAYVNVSNITDHFYHRRSLSLFLLLSATFPILWITVNISIKPILRPLFLFSLLFSSFFLVPKLIAYLWDGSGIVAYEKPRSRTGTLQQRSHGSKISYSAC